MAYVVSVSDSAHVTVDLDYVEFFFGDEAIAMAKQDGMDIIEVDENGVEHIPNDYYLRNINEQLRTFPLAANCLIQVLPEEGGADATESVTPGQLREMVGTYKRLMEVVFTPSGTEIASLSEFFVP